MGRRLSRRPSLRGFGGLLGALLVAGLLTTPPQAVADVAAAEPTSTASDTNVGNGTEDAALAEAARTGKDVEVAALRSETAEVFAKPDGTLEAIEHLRPVRTRVDGAWKDIDTTLERRSDGSVAPKVAATGIVFSGGGDQPLIRLEQAGRALSLSWPDKLPEPVLDGATATYSTVLPDVDLQVRADIDGISQVLVVKSAEAAANPKLAELRLAMDAEGMTVGKTADGGLAATDSGAGGTVFEAPRPLMWDSSKGTGTAMAKTASLRTADAAAAAAGEVPSPGESAQVAPLGVEVTAGGAELVLTPDQKLLKDATYPVYIDPQWYSPKAGSWTMVSKYWASSPQWRFNGESDAGMGYCAGDARCAPQDVKRLFYAVPTSRFAGKTILSAEFVVKETHSYSCDKKDVQLYRTKGISSSTTWNSQDNDAFWADLLQTRSEANGWSGDCPGGNVEFWALRAVQQAAANGWATTTFGLRAKSETDPYAWKRFADDAWLRVQYNRPPGQIKMSQLTQKPGGTCSSTAKRVRILPTLRANNVTDPDGDSVAVQFQASWDTGDSKGFAARWTSSRSTYKKSGSDFSITLPSSTPKNKLIGWHARSYDGAQWSPWSYTGSATDCMTVYDTSVPAEPRITSAQYPESDAENPDDPWLDGVGRYGTFTIDSTATDVTKYWFGVNTQPTSAHTLTTSGGGAKTMKFMPTKSGVNFVTAQAFDTAGNGSSIGIYYFRVRAGQPDLATWDLDETAGSDAVSGRGGDWPATLSASGATVGGEGALGKGLRLDGTQGYAATVSPVLNTAKNFTVSVWAKVGDIPRDAPEGAVAVSQMGAVRSAFELYYSPSRAGWVFVRHATDTEGSTASRAMQPACASGDTACASSRTNRWTHLVGAFNGIDDVVKLYVDGQLVATAAFSGPWDARGQTMLGANRKAGVLGGFFKGNLDEAQFFDYQLTDGQVQTLAAKQPVDTARPAKLVFPLDEASDPAPLAVIGRGQTLAASLHGGATPGGAGVAGTALTLDGTDDYAETNRPVLDTARSFSVSLWARLPKDKAVRPMTAIRQTDTVKPGFEIYHSSNLGGWVFARETANSTGSTAVRATQSACPANENCAAAGLGEWNHVVGVYDYDADQIRLYVNGVLKDTEAFTTPWLATLKVSLGAAADATGSASNFLEGGMDDVRLYDRVISGDEVKNLFKQHPVVKARWKLESAAGTPSTSPDASAGGRPVTLYNGATTGGGWVDDGALVLDGDNDYAATGSVPVDTSQSFTVTAWAIAPSGRPQESGTILSQQGDLNSAFTVGYEPGPDDGDPSTPIATGRWRITMTDVDDTDSSDNDTEVGEKTAGSTLYDDSSANGWNHLALVYDAFADQMTLYVNGQPEAFVCGDSDADGTQDDPSCTDHVSWADNTLGFNATKSLQIGRAKTAGVPGDYWSGAIDDVWAFQGALDQEQIQQLALGTRDLPTTVPGSGSAG
ncbi:LamG domain-containing protein [Streptomyces sp. NBC_01604]|uniref:LamG-like jellyroll fold domain-containing protein n=1 Tax=Streptomyces sp. NBC_01604 TaxID=2975894 RepID=UPI00386E92BF